MCVFFVRSHPRHEIIPAGVRFFPRVCVCVRLPHSIAMLANCSWQSLAESAGLMVRYGAPMLYRPNTSLLFAPTRTKISNGYLWCHRDLCASVASFVPIHRMCAPHSGHTYTLTPGSFTWVYSSH